MNETSRSSVQVPDPTLLTTAALKLSIENLKELMETKISQTDSIMSDKFRELEKRFGLIEKQRLELKDDSAKAIAAALSAQERLFAQQTKCTEEASAKQETSVSKQLEAVTSAASLSRQALDDKITALKERIDRGGGREEQQLESRHTVGWVVPMISVSILTVLSLVVEVILLTHK